MEYDLINPMESISNNITVEIRMYKLYRDPILFNNIQTGIHQQQKKSFFLSDIHMYA